MRPGTNNYSVLLRLSLKVLSYKHKKIVRTPVVGVASWHFFFSPNQMKLIPPPPKSRIVDIWDKNSLLTLVVKRRIVWWDLLPHKIKILAASFIIITSITALLMPRVSPQWWTRCTSAAQACLSFLQCLIYYETFMRFHIYLVLLRHLKSLTLPL